MKQIIQCLVKRYKKISILYVHNIQDNLFKYIKLTQCIEAHSIHF